MKTDRELLELAAKAAGWEYQSAGKIDIEQKDLDGWIDPASGDVHWRDLWNPLTNDGDALRLAVACKLTVCTDGDATVSACEAFKPETGAFATQSVSKCADKNAATRRAIVRAAAEIGEGMA